MIGIGLIEAALGIARVLRETSPKAVLLVGSCGAYSKHAIGDVVCAHEAVLGASQGALGPIPQRARPPKLARKETIALACSTLSITTDDEAARALAATTRAEIENLEVFAVARACEIANVPFAALLGVTNAVGASGRTQWRENAERVAKRVIAAI